MNRVENGYFKKYVSVTCLRLSSGIWNLHRASVQHLGQVIDLFKPIYLSEDQPEIKCD